MDYITLNPQESGDHIMKTAKHVKVDLEKCKEAALLVMDAVVEGKIGDIDYSANPLHPSGLSDEEKMLWVFLLDVLNFSFWPDEGEEYNVTFEGQTYTGYLAMCAAFRKAHKELNAPIATVQWMLTVDVGVLDFILKDDKGFSIPMITQRKQAVKEAGEWLFWSHDASFLNVVRKSNCNAQVFLRYILACESFRDYGFYNNRKVSFFKRAQILINDTVGALIGSEENKHLVDFKDLDTLSMFADYRVPQALNYLECLEYSPELLDELQSNKLLTYGSEKEVEIRGASIYAVQQMYKEIQRVRAAGPYRDMDFTNARRLLPIDIDVWLWMFRREHADEVESIVPFHRTRSIYY